MLKQILAVSAVTAAAWATGAQAGDNPLQPSYYWNRVAVESKAVGAPTNVPVNPLHPTYFARGEAPAPITETSAQSEANNPLHPQFRRS